MFKRAFVAQRPFLPLEDQVKAAKEAGADRIHILGKNGTETVDSFISVLRPGNVAMFFGYYALGIDREEAKRVTNLLARKDVDQFCLEVGAPITKRTLTAMDRNFDQKLRAQKNLGSHAEAVRRGKLNPGKRKVDPARRSLAKLMSIWRDPKYATDEEAAAAIGFLTARQCYRRFGKSGRKPGRRQQRGNR